MINLRYHIISITAVFLALGIGLTLGSTFLDRATVDVLNTRLQGLEKSVKATDAENAQLRKRVSELDRRDLLLSEQLPEHALDGLLTGVPVLVVNARGVDKDLVSRSISALKGAGANVVGTWRYTDRFALDDDAEVRDLAAALESTSTDPARLRRVVASRLADILRSAGRPVTIPVIPPDEAPTTVPPSATEPPLVGALRSAGFIEYDVPSGAPSDKVLLADGAMRYVVIAGGGAQVADDAFINPLLAAVTAEGPAPVVATQGTTDPRAPEEARISFVGPLRADDAISAKLSTVDDLESAAGLVALVLAEDDLATLKVGHYGTSSTASRLLPAPEPSG
jgi:hypothetical protein